MKRTGRGVDELYKSNKKLSLYEQMLEEAGMLEIRDEAEVYDDGASRGRVANAW